MANRAKITEILVRAMKKPGVIMDSRLFGFGVRRAPKGRISFLVRKVVDGKDIRKVIGVFPNMSVKTARKTASEMLAQLKPQAVALAAPPLASVAPLDAKLQKIEQMLLRVCAPEMECDLTFQELFDQVADSYWEKKKPKTRLTYERYLASTLLPRFGSLPLRELTADVIEKWYVGHKGVAGGRPTQPCKILMSILNHAKKKKIIRSVPDVDVETFESEEREAFDELTAERIEHYYFNRVCSPDVHPSELAIWVGLHTAERAEALVSLAADEVNFKTKKVWKQRKGRQGKDFYALVYSDEVLRFLKQLLPLRGRFFFERPGRPGDHVQAQMVRRHFQRDCKRFGWKLESGTSPCLHTLRHTFLTHMGTSGVPIPVIAKLAGHRDYKTTMRYVHGDELAAREATNKHAFGRRRRKRTR